MNTYVLCAVAVLLAVGVDAKKKEKSFDEKIADCADTARDDYPSEGTRCLSFFNDYVAANRTTMFETCEAQWCNCTGGVWNTGNNTCNTATSTCGLSCGCMERCYAPFLDCNYKAVWNVFKMNKDCNASELTECMEDNLDDARKECKRGVDAGRIAWMDTPVPEDCDEDLICAAGGYAPSVVLVAAAAVAALLH